MAITTLDGVIAGFKKPQPFQKLTGTMELAGVAHTPWYVAGLPAASIANTAGVNGVAVTPALTATHIAGRIPRTNPVSGNAYLGRLSATASVAGTLMLVDRLWHNSGLSTTLTTAQAITPATLPARDTNETTDGVGVIAGIEWSAAGGAGTPTVTLTYTDSAGNTGQTTSFVGNTTPVAGTVELFPSVNGGVRAPTSFIQSATRTSGTMHLVLYRIIATLEVTAANIGNSIDALTSGMPEIYDDSVLQLLWIPTATTTTQITGQYIETQG